MESGYELVLGPSGPTPRSLALGARPVYVGRSPQSDLAVGDKRVSWQHVRVWVQDGVIRVADLGSRNGTWINERRVLGTTTAAPGDTIRVADGIELLVRGSQAAAQPEQFVVEEVETGLRYPIRGGVFEIGPDPSADLRVPVGGTLRVLQELGGFSVAAEGTSRPLSADESFHAGSLALRVRAVSLVPRTTMGESAGGLLPYDVECWLGRGVVEVRAPGGQVLVRLVGAAQTTLLWVLATAHLEDATSAEPERGWRDEHGVVVRVWGRSGLEGSQNRLKVLLHRIRKQLRAASVDPDVVERREGQLRLRAARASAHA